MNQVNKTENGPAIGLSVERLLGSDLSDFVRQVCTYLGSPDNADLQAAALTVSRETKDPRTAAVLVMRRMDTSDRWKDFARSLGFNA